MSKETIDLLVEGGKAAPGPTTAPKLSEYKLNIGEVFKEINEKTKEYAGMNVPVKLIIDKKTKEYSIKVGTPPVSSLVKKELGLKKLAPEKEEEKEETTKEDEKNSKKVKKAKKNDTSKKEKQIVIMGNLTIDQIIKITKMKRENLLAKNMKSAVKEIVSSIVSMPLTIENKKPKEFLKDINEGKYDEKIKE
ncbi:MAG: 50S ribosomal protein L11 [Candidatus Aenigmarchaeota archaeon]|nr:50S ribosomal protein L11 [Candidatus Aenigmarchaeota archaeon]